MNMNVGHSREYIDRFNEYQVINVETYSPIAYSLCPKIEIILAPRSQIFLTFTNYI
jgi:hypothetical protein